MPASLTRAQKGSKRSSQGERQPSRVQIGEGRYVGAATLLGILVGVLAYAPMHRRFFKWDMGTCSV